MKKLAKNLP